MSFQKIILILKVLRYQTHHFTSEVMNLIFVILLYICLPPYPQYNYGHMCTEINACGRESSRHVYAHLYNHRVGRLYK